MQITDYNNVLYNNVVCCTRRKETVSKNLQVHPRRIALLSQQTCCAFPIQGIQVLVNTNAVLLFYLRKYLFYYTHTNVLVPVPV